jgi:hypothetical protein
VLPKGRAGRKDKAPRLRPRRVDDVHLQPDDLLMLELLDQHRLMNSRQLFSVAGGDRNERAFLHRLRRMFDAEYLTRPPHQRRAGEPSVPMVYGLGVRGHQTLHPAQWTGPKAVPPRDWRQKDRRIRTYAIQHEIALTEALLALRAAAEAQEWSLRWSEGESFRKRTGFPRTVEVRPAYGDALAIPLNPDAFITCDTGEHRYHWFLEIDMSTEPHERRDLRRSSVRQKLLAYRQLNQDRLRHFDRTRDTFRVLLITTTQERMHNMREAAQQVDPKQKGSHFFLFSTHDRCSLKDPDAILTDHVWWTARAGYDNPRKLFLDACPKCQQLIDPANEPHEILNAARGRLVLAPASTPLDDLVTADGPVYAHLECPGLRAASQS